MLLGAEIGHDFPNVATHLRVLAMIFLRLIKTIIAPLLFATLVVGIAGHSNLRQVGRLGLRSIIFFEIVTTIGDFSRPGRDQPDEGRSRRAAADTAPASDSGYRRQAQRRRHHPARLPGEHRQSGGRQRGFAGGGVQPDFRMALAMISETEAPPSCWAFCESLAETMFKFTNIVMYMAPIGVGAAVAYTVAHTGLGILGSLLKLVLTLYAALLVFVFGVLLPIALLFRVPLTALCEGCHPNR